MCVEENMIGFLFFSLTNLFYELLLEALEYGTIKVQFTCPPGVLD